VQRPESTRNIQLRRLIAANPMMGVQAQGDGPGEDKDDGGPNGRGQVAVDASTPTFAKKGGCGGKHGR
jgi:hypothetical protein